MRHLHPTLLVALALVLTTGPPARAQEDKEAEAAALRAERAAATSTFLDSSQPVAERLQAVTRLGYPDEETMSALVRIGADTAEPDAVRLAALEKARYDEPYLDTVFEIIARPTESGELASELIYEVGRRTTFRQPAAVRQRLQSALRDRLDDPRDPVRLAAYRVAVASHDMVAVDRLVQPLKDGDRPPIPLGDALELLDVDGPAKHLVTARPFLRHPDARVQAQALRVLAVDPESRGEVIELVRSRSTARVARVSGLRALAREDEEYMAYALRLVADRSEDADVRYAALEGGMIRLNYHNEPADSQVRFALAVQALAAQPDGGVTSTGLDLGAEAKKLFDHLRRHFPAVRRHFAFR
ncbi:MAG: hypothetical protein R3325_09340 [Thermoanaerobaculia bacterium]|nr:hypothetical protein [Thermoanaerobaculia bacterium]